MRGAGGIAVRSAPVGRSEDHVQLGSDIRSPSRCLSGEADVPGETPAAAVTGRRRYWAVRPRGRCGPSGAAARRARRRYRRAATTAETPAAQCMAVTNASLAELISRGPSGPRCGATAYARGDRRTWLDRVPAPAARRGAGDLAAEHAGDQRSQHGDPERAADLADGVLHRRADAGPLARHRRHDGLGGGRHHVGHSDALDEEVPADHPIDESSGQAWPARPGRA